MSYLFSLSKLALDRLDYNADDPDREEFSNDMHLVFTAKPKDNVVSVETDQT